MLRSIFRNITILICLFAFSLGASAQDAGAPCGMEATASGEKVKSGSFEICPEDLAFQGTYLLWSDIFKDPIFRAVSLYFVDEATLTNSFTQFADQQMGLSDITYALLSACAVLCWMLLFPLLAFKSYQYFSFIRKTGSYTMNDDKGDTVKFVSYVLFLLIMILPVNNRVMLGQGLAIVMSLPSIMGGNFILSTYLSSFRDSASTVRMNEDSIIMSSQGAANAMIENELCQDRTRKALFSLNGAQFSDFFNAEILYVDNEDVREVYSSCLSYVGLGETGEIDNSLSSISFNKLGSRQIRCPKLDAWPGAPARYIKDQHGHDHSCGKIIYNMSTDMYSSLLESEHSEMGSDMDDVVEGAMNAFKAKQFYVAHKRQYAYDINQIISNESLNDAQKYEAIDAVVVRATNAMKSVMASTPALSIGNIDELQIAHLGAGTALLGGTVDRNFLYQSFQRNIRGGALSSIQGDFLANYYFPAHTLPDRVYGVDYLLEDARDVARLMQEYHCAMNWDKYTSTRLAITKFNTAGNIRGEFASGMPSMECITVLPESLEGDSDTNRYWMYSVRDPRAYDDIVNQAGSTWVKVTGDTSSTQEYMSTVVAQRIYREMRLKQLLLTTYIASAQKALAANLSEKLNESIDNRTSYYDLRSRGWAVFGGTLLYLNKTQNSSGHMANAIQEILQVQSAGEADTYIEPQAFPQAKLSELTNRIDALYSPLDDDGLFSIGYGGMRDHPGPQGVSEDEEEEISFNNLLRIIEEWTMSPLQHVKEAGGLPANKRLTEGLKECFDNGYSECVSGRKHPMTALMQFGDETMNNMLNLMIVRAVVKTINRVVAGAGDGLEVGSVSAGQGPSYEKHKKATKSFFGDALKKGMAVVKGAVSRLLTIITVISIPAESLLDTLMPFAVMLLVVGALFAFIIPLTAYLYGFMLFALWMVGIAVIAFVIPFYALSKFFNIEKSYQRGFQDFYEGFVGPYLRPLFYGIAAVLAFSFMYIVVFAANTVFGLVHDGLSTSGSSNLISGMIFDVLMYVMYLATILIMFRYALGIMKSFPDMMMSKLRLQRSNDEKFIDSLGFESYLNARIVQEVASNLNRSVDQIAGGSLKQREQMKQFEDFNKMIDDAGGPERFAEALSALQKKNAQGNQQSFDMVNMSPNDMQTQAAAPNSTQQSTDDANRMNNDPSTTASVPESEQTLPWASPAPIEPKKSNATKPSATSESFTQEDLSDLKGAIDKAKAEQEKGRGTTPRSLTERLSDALNESSDELKNKDSNGDGAPKPPKPPR